MFSQAISLYLLGWLAASSLLFVMPMLGLGDNVASYYSNLLQITSALINTVLCLRTATIFERGDPMRAVWSLMGAGVLSWGLGEILYAGYIILHNGAETPYPWFSDIGFLSIQPLIVLALFTFARAMAVRPPTWGIVLSLLLLVSSLIYAYYTSYGNLETAKTSLESVAMIAYILFDPILLAATVLSASLLTGGLLARPWWFCFSGLTLYYLSNRIFEIQTAQKTYMSGGWIDLGWVLAFILIGVAAMLAYDMLRQEN